MKSLVRKIILVFFCLFILSSSGCKKFWDDNFPLEDSANVDPNGLITLTCENPNGIRADGVSIAKFIVTIPADATERMVIFKTSSGSFIGAAGANTITVIADSGGNARAELKVTTKPVDVEVTATVGVYAAPMCKLTLLPAHADKINGETSTLFVNKTGSMQTILKAILTRNVGNVSIGIKVDFFASQLNDQNEEISVGRFLNKELMRTNEKGIATATFAADKGDCIVGSQVKIRMVTDKDDGTQAEFVLYLNVVE